MCENVFSENNNVFSNFVYEQTMDQYESFLTQVSFESSNSSIRLVIEPTDLEKVIYL